MFRPTTCHYPHIGSLLPHILSNGHMHNSYCHISRSLGIWTLSKILAQGGCIDHWNWGYLKNRSLNLLELPLKFFGLVFSFLSTAAETFSSYCGTSRLSNWGGGGYRMLIWTDVICMLWVWRFGALFDGAPPMPQSKCSQVLFLLISHPFSCLFLALHRAFKWSGLGAF